MFGFGQELAKFGGMGVPTLFGFGQELAKMGGMGVGVRGSGCWAAAGGGGGEGGERRERKSMVNDFPVCLSREKLLLLLNIFFIFIFL